MACTFPTHGVKGVLYERKKFDMDSMILKILGIIGALSVVWWMHVRNKQFNGNEPKRLLPILFVPMMFFAGLLANKLVEDMQAQRIPETYSFMGSIFTASFFVGSLFLFSVWLRASQKRL